MPTIITDNPALVSGLATSLLMLLVAFGVPLTDEQHQAILGLVAAITAILAFVAHQATVPKTPSDAEPQKLQVPPAGTVLVTDAGAQAAGPVPDEEIVAKPTP